MRAQLFLGAFGRVTTRDLGMLLVWRERARGKGGKPGRCTRSPFGSSSAGTRPAGCPWPAASARMHTLDKNQVLVPSGEGRWKGFDPPACAAMPTMWSVAVLRGAEHVLHGPAIGRVSKGLEMGVGGGLCASMGVTCDPGIVVHIPIGCGASARIGLRTSAWLRAARACTAGQLKACGGRQWW